MSVSLGPKYFHVLYPFREIYHLLLPRLIVTNFLITFFPSLFLSGHCPQPMNL